MFVYKLENGRYFLSNKNESIDELNKYTYCRMFEPQELLETIECKNSNEEEKYLIRYMKRYGVNNVRGCNYTNVEYELSDIIELQKKLGYKRIFKDNEDSE